MRVKYIMFWKGIKGQGETEVFSSLPWYTIFYIHSRIKGFGGLKHTIGR